MRLQLPTPAVPDPPRSEAGGAGPRLKNRLDAEPPVSNGRDDFSSHLRRQRADAEPVATRQESRSSDSIQSESDRSGSNDSTSQTASAVPADESQELPDSEAPASELEQTADVVEAAAVSPQAAGTPVASTLEASAVAGSSASALQSGAPLVSPTETGSGPAMGPFNDRSLGPIDRAVVTGPLAPLTGSSAEALPTPSGAIGDPSATTSSAEQGLPDGAEEAARTTRLQSPQGSTENRTAVQQAPTSVSDRASGEPSPATNSGRADGVAEQRAGAALQRAESSADSAARSYNQRPAGPERGTPLAALLKAHGAELTSGERAASVDPAMSRVREVQQQVNQANQAQQVNQAPPVHSEQAGPARPAPLPVTAGAAVTSIGIDAGGSDARTTVLGDVLARSGAEAKLADQTTQLTARGMSALASQRGGSLNIRLNPTSLGEVSIRMTVVEGVVRADLVASSAAARTMLEGGLEVLRGAMEARGLTVDRLVVQAGSEAGSSRSESQGQSNQGSAREQAGDGRQDAAGQQSRGRGEGGRDRSDNHESRYAEQGGSFTHLMDEEST